MIRKTLTAVVLAAFGALAVACNNDTGIYALPPEYNEPAYVDVPSGASGDDDDDDTPPGDLPEYNPCDPFDPIIPEPLQPEGDDRGSCFGLMGGYLLPPPGTDDRLCTMIYFGQCEGWTASGVDDDLNIQTLIFEDSYTTPEGDVVPLYGLGKSHGGAFLCENNEFKHPMSAEEAEETAFFRFCVGYLNDEGLGYDTGEIGPSTVEIPLAGFEGTVDGWYLTQEERDISFNDDIVLDSIDVTSLTTDITCPDDAQVIADCYGTIGK